MKTGGMGKWQVHEINVDGTDLTKISRDASFHDLDPAYLGDGRILFTTDRAGCPNHWNRRARIRDNLSGSSGKTTQHIKQDKPGVSHGVFDIIAKDPEKPHVADDVHPAAMHEHRCKCRMSR